MLSTASALPLGLLAGIAGAVLPGPLSVTLAERAASGERGVVVWRGTGGALVHLLSCVAVGLATGPLLERIARTPLERAVLAVGYVVFGAVLVAREALDGRRRRRRAPAAGGHALGGLTLATKWVLVIGFAAWSGFVELDAAASVGFAAGVWLGVLAWGVALVLGARAIGVARLGVALRAMTVSGGTMLIGLGVWAAAAATLHV